MTVETLVLGGRDARHFLATRWQGLLRNDKHATVYQSPGFLTAHARHLPPAAGPLVLVAHRGATPVAALALARQAVRQRSLVTALGSPHAEYIRSVGPGSEDPEVVDSFIRELRHFNRTESVALADVPLESELGQHLARMRDWSANVSRCAAVPLPVPFQQLNPSARRAHRERRAVWDQVEQEHTVEFRLCAGAALPQAWDELVGLYQAQHGSTQRPPAEQQLLDVTATVPGAFVARLSVDGTVIAADLCLRWRERVHAVLPAKHPEWSHCSPPHALLYRLAEKLGRAAGGRGRPRVLDVGRTRDRTGHRVASAHYGMQWTAMVTVASTHGRAAGGPPVYPLGYLQHQGAA